MSNKRTRQERKAQILSAPAVSLQELLDPGLMNLNYEFITPPYQTDNMTLLEIVAEVKQRRASLIAGLMDGSYRMD